MYNLDMGLGQLIKPIKLDLHGMDSPKRLIRINTPQWLVLEDQFNSPELVVQGLTMFWLKLDGRIIVLYMVSVKKKSLASRLPISISCHQTFAHC